MQRIQRRLWLGYGLVFGGAVLLALALIIDAVSGAMLGFPLSIIWFFLAIIPSAGIALIFLTAIEERPVEREKPR
ncbi:hypothetical protein V0U79_02565 [Hyphobacterium sp. HN65]|uniref:DUF2842 domain-containing protein n=1 Tax=Hyphobacterium lacteum TaxID=3116575 RepID=A0ABU7LMT5_9PROT|nr:hypothetical protein [Hyphobacterium sp. HN65]MEE2525232.1 hypothetical protein [Hyphobacterium sp. HN65]